MYYFRNNFLNRHSSKMANRRFMGGVNEFSWEFDQDMDEMDTFSGSNYRGDYRYIFNYEI